jgi:hypothetical protein
VISAHGMVVDAGSHFQRLSDHKVLRKKMSGG